jgi:carboxyl-terminal processing protease
MEVTRRTLLMAGASAGAAAFAGPAIAAEAGSEPGGFRAIAQSINATIRANHYRPAELDSVAYRQIEAEVVALGQRSATADAFLAGFNALWRRGPFSHVGLRRADEPAAAGLARLDTQIAGDGAVSLAWQGEAAVLTVNTMSGADTIEKIEAAYDAIAARGAERLILDLRANGGGAFAVVPLVGHLLSEPIVAGVFASRLWYRDHDAPPGPSDFPSAVPWRGYSVPAFLAEMLARPLTGYVIDPLEPRYRGPVFVLTSRRSISAAEIAADALKAAGRATIIGEKTPGALLSSRLFDVPEGFHLRIPVADYYSIANGRIEGVGITPDVPTTADQALQVALAHPLR